jgi:hypothetical protein
MNEIDVPDGECAGRPWGTWSSFQAVYANPIRPKDAGTKTVEALKKGVHLSERLIRYAEKERRVGGLG